MTKNTAEKTKKKIGLSTQIFIALLIGALFGVVIHYWIPSSYIKDTVIVEGVLYVVGQGFIRLMQMLVVLDNPMPLQLAVHIFIVQLLQIV